MAATQSTEPMQRRWRRGLFLVILIGIFGLFLYGTITYLHVNPGKITQLAGADTVLYDRYGKPYAQLGKGRGDFVPLDKISPYMQNAILAIEDQRFYQHGAIDPVGILRALAADITHRGIVEGGSTLTQQLAKNLYYSPKQTLQRKFKEAIAAEKLELHYSKNQILDDYLNTIYLGNGAYGVQDAAQTYFGKNAVQLTLAQSALLAGLPKAPSYYDPYLHPEAAKTRRNLVLEKMYELKMITEAQRKQAEQSPIRLAGRRKTDAQQQIKYPSYVDEVLREAEQKLGISEQDLLTKGLHIYTNLDPKVQQAAESIYVNRANFPDDKGGLESGVVLLDPQTGAVRGLVGQIGKQQAGDFNYAAQTRRQPGSSIKPIAVYGPALEDGFKPYDEIDDVRTNFHGYQPDNYGHVTHGWVTLEQALVHSYNIPAVATLNAIGLNKGYDTALNAGLPLAPSDRNLALALGGLKQGVSPMQMAQAYSMFANGGVVSQAYTIKEIVNANHETVLESRPEQRQVLSPSTAYDMTRMMEKVISEGTGTQARMNRPAAGKTGTTQLPDIPEYRNRNGQVIDGTEDAWFVGYTPQLVASIWVGYPTTDRHHYLNTTGGHLPAVLFREIMERALAGNPIQDFQPPKDYQAPSGPVHYINGTPPPKPVQRPDQANPPVPGKNPPVNTAKPGTSDTSGNSSGSLPAGGSMGTSQSGIAGESSTGGSTSTGGAKSGTGSSTMTGGTTDSAGSANSTGDTTNTSGSVNSTGGAVGGTGRSTSNGGTTSGTGSSSSAGGTTSGTRSLTSATG